MSVDYFHSAALVAAGCVLLCLWVTGFSGVFPTPRNHTETIPTILPCSRQCWRRIEMGARRRTRVCRPSDGKRNACLQATAGPRPQHLWMLCQCGNFPKCLSRRHRPFFKFQKEDWSSSRAELKAKLLYVCIFKIECHLNHHSSTVSTGAEKKAPNNRKPLAVICNYMAAPSPWLQRSVHKQRLRTSTER